jgi:hypothetical protein
MTQCKHKETYILRDRYEICLFCGKPLRNLKCSECGANIEMTVFDDGTEIIRQDCLCNFDKAIKEI